MIKIFYIRNNNVIHNLLKGNGDICSLLVRICFLNSLMIIRRVQTGKLMNEIHQYTTTTITDWKWDEDAHFTHLVEPHIKIKLVPINSEEDLLLEFEFLHWNIKLVPRKD
uniref:Uncharacterized protein n=1 Tax=Cacopsylla melanoneura TaxID=428564 RepID=A0A8D9BQU4_9HEMI